MGCCTSSEQGLAWGVPVQVRVWRTGTSEKYPEMKELPELFENTANLGLALGGGGIRAACVSLGILMALEQLHLLSKVRYTSSVSGASWLTAPYSFLPEKFCMSKFINAVVPPAGLTPEVIDNPPKGSYLHTASKARPTRKLFANLAVDLVKRECEDCCRQNLRAWNKVVTREYLGPYGLHEQSGLMAPYKGTEAHCRAARQIKSTQAHLFPHRKGTPFPILNASQKVRIIGEKTSDWYALEFTPLYGGAPALIADAPGGVIGGGVVESFGLGGSAPMSLPDGRTSCEDGEVVTQKPVSFMPLSFACGAGSGAPYVQNVVQIKSTDSQKSLGGPVMNLWSPAEIDSLNNGVFMLADAGITDDTGILALLRRGVKNIIIGMAPHFNPLENGDANEALKKEWWPGLFGLATEDSLVGVDADVDQLNRGMKVFEEEDLQPFWDQVVAKLEAGEPCVVDTTWKVLRNDVCGVQGGYTVRILWVESNLSRGFESKLPEATRQRLKRSPTDVQHLKQKATQGKLFYGDILDNNFPYVPSWIGDYSADLCTMLAQNAAYNLLQGAGEEKLRDFFKD